VISTSSVWLSGLWPGITEWTSTQSTDGVIKAEVANKVIMLSEVTLAETGGSNSITVAVKKKNGSGDVIFQITLAGGAAIHIRFAKWREGDPYDGSDAGDLYLDITGSGTLSAFWIGVIYP